MLMLDCSQPPLYGPRTRAGVTAFPQPSDAASGTRLLRLPSFTQLKDAAVSNHSYTPRLFHTPPVSTEPRRASTWNDVRSCRRAAVGPRHGQASTSIFFRPLIRKPWDLRALRGTFLLPDRPALLRPPGWRPHLAVHRRGRPDLGHLGRSSFTRRIGSSWFHQARSRLRAPALVLALHEDVRPVRPRTCWRTMDGVSLDLLIF